MVGYHRPVLLREVLEALHIKKGSWYLDCTLGDGGLSLEILRLGGNVVGIDVDPQALERVRERVGSLGYLGKNLSLVQGNFRDVKNLIQPASQRGEQTDQAGLKFAGAIFDLGVSSLQLESPQRGFSFSKLGPLDMRMDPTLQVKAADLLNVLSRKELDELFKNLGEEKYSWRLAGAFVRAREIGYRVKGIGFSNTKELVEVIEKTLGHRRLGEIHPATRVFQALRIAVNDELNALQEGLTQVKDLIERGSILVISFHSLEDRIVKFTFREWEDRGFGQVKTKKPIVPTKEETLRNPRSRSAKLRVFYDN